MKKRLISLLVALIVVVAMFAGVKGIAAQSWKFAGHSFYASGYPGPYPYLPGAYPAPSSGCYFLPVVLKAGPTLPPGVTPTSTRTPTPTRTPTRTPTPTATPTDLPGYPPQP